MPGQASPTCRLHAHSQAPQLGSLTVPTSPCPSQALSTCCTHSTEFSPLPPFLRLWSAWPCRAAKRGPGLASLSPPGCPTRDPLSTPMYADTCTYSPMLTCMHTHSYNHMHLCSHACTHSYTCTHMPVLKCMHTNSCTHIHLCSHACIHIHLCSQAHTLTYTCAHMHVCTHTRIHVCSHAHTHTLTPVLTYVYRQYTPSYTCARMHAYTHTQTQLCSHEYTHSRTYLCSHACRHTHTTLSHALTCTHDHIHRDRLTPV